MPAWGPWLALACGIGATGTSVRMLYDWATIRTGYTFTLAPCVLLILAGLFAVGFGIRGVISRR